MIFEIQCGAHHVTIEAPTIGEAWRSVTGNIQHGFAPLARFRELRRLGTGKWFYVTPSALDSMAGTPIRREDAKG